MPGAFGPFGDRAVLSYRKSDSMDPAHNAHGPGSFGVYTMAKSKKITTDANLATPGKYPSQIAFAGLSLTTEHPGFATGLETMASAMGVDPRGVFYVLQYGFGKSLQDSVSGMAKAMLGEKDESGERKHTDAEIEAALAEKRQERYDSIVAGDVSTRTTGPRVKGLEKVMQEIAWESIVAQCAKVNASRAKDKQIVLPKKVADQAPLIAQYLAKHGDTVRAEAEERLAKANARGEEDLSELFAGLVPGDASDESTEDESPEGE